MTLDYALWVLKLYIVEDIRLDEELILSYKYWSDCDIIKHYKEASSATNLLSLMGYKKSSYKLSRLKKDLDRLDLKVGNCNKFDYESVKTAVKESITYSECLRKLGKQVQGGSIKQLQKFISE